MGLSFVTLNACRGELVIGLRKEREELTIEKVIHFVLVG